MATFEEFVNHLQEALTHLYDPTFQPHEIIRAAVGYRPGQEGRTLTAIIHQAIEELQPDPETPVTARSHRIYEVLACRYIQGLTQVETAYRLGISPRHLRREQRQAVEVLARKLSATSQPAPKPGQPQPKGLRGQTPSRSWQSQVRQDLASLHQHAPGVLSNVGETVVGMLPVGRTLATRHNVLLEAAPIPPDLKTTIHPTALRQILLTAVEKLVQHMSSGQITLNAEKRGQAIALKVAGQPLATDITLSSDFIQETLALEGGKLEIIATADRLTFAMSLPRADKIKVLLIDDNTDLVHFYRRYVAKTRFEIIHIADGRHLFETIETLPPDVIVLDVMLPDIDGWELLTHLHEHPATRSIPVIVCSVVRREELALALGAAYYIAKPVRRMQFIQALEQVLGAGQPG
jgi:CheY-like chemotaxis protein